MLIFYALLLLQAVTCQAEETATLEAGGLKAVFDLEQGQLSTLQDANGNWATGPATLRLNVEGKWLQTGSDLPFIGGQKLVDASHSTESGGLQENIVLTYADDVWEIQDIWQADLQHNTLNRKAVIARLGGETPELKIRSLQMDISGLTCDQRWSRHNMTLLHDMANNRGVLSFADDRDEDVATDLISNDQGLKLRISPQVLARMKVRDRQIVGTQVWRTCSGDLLACKKQAQNLFHDLGLIPPKIRPESAQDVILYSLHPGGNIDTWFMDVGSFDNLSKWLPGLKRLGMNTLWVLPTYTYCVNEKLGDGCPYGPSDFWRQEPALGGEAGARRFVDAAHELDLKVLFDLVPHGGSYVDRERHPNWIIRDEEGNPVNWFGAGCDYSAPGYQRDIRDIVEQTVRTLDLDGFRIDCAEGGPANWSTDQKRVSASTLAGSTGMMAAIRHGFELAKPGTAPILYPENWATYPAHAPVIDIHYGGPFYWFINDLRKSDRIGSEWGPQMQKWLSDEYWGTPLGTLQGRFITNHDMDRDNGPASMGWGMARSRAMMAMCYGIEGAPHIYQEQEVGSGPYYARLAQLRMAIPELRRGTPDYDSIQADKLFACIRKLENQATIILVNYDTNDVETQVNLKSGALEDMPQIMQAFDLFQNEALQQITNSQQQFNIKMPAMSARYIVLRSDTDALEALREAAGLKTEGTTAAAETSDVVVENDGVTISSPLQAMLQVTTTEVNGEQLLHQTLANDTGNSISQVKYDLQKDGDDTLINLQITPQQDLSTKAGKSIEIALTAPQIARWFAMTQECLWEDWQMDRHFTWNDGPGYGYGPGIMHDGKQLADRLYESGVHPLNKVEPWIALADTQGNVTGLKIDQIQGLQEDFPTPNVYYSDGSSKNLALAQSGWRIALVDRNYPGHPERGLRIVGGKQSKPAVTLPAGEPITLTLRLRTGKIGQADERQPWQKALHNLLNANQIQWQLKSTGSIEITSPPQENVVKGMADMTWGMHRTMTLNWNLRIGEAGAYDLWIRARNSETAAKATDLCDKYIFTVNGQIVEADWQALGTEQIGENGFVGWLRLPRLNLPEDVTTLQVETTVPWCAIDDRFILSADPNWLPW